MTDPTGLFSFDTRFLSRWILTVDDRRLSPLSTDDMQYFEAKFFLVPGTGMVYVDAKVSVIRSGRLVTFGSHLMRSPYRALYRTGYVLMVAGLLFTVGLVATRSAEALRHSNPTLGRSGRAPAGEPR